MGEATTFPRRTNQMFGIYNNHVDPGRISRFLYNNHYYCKFRFPEVKAVQKASFSMETPSPTLPEPPVVADFDALTRAARQERCLCENTLLAYQRAWRRLSGVVRERQNSTR